MSAEFKSKYEASSEPIFKISHNGEVTHGCRAIETTNKAVFIYVSSFLCCLGFWMPIETYKTMSNGYIKGGKNPINFNNTLYTY
jgi:hypothetical protein